MVATSTTQFGDQPAVAALDVEELLHAHVRAEAGFGEHVAVGPTSFSAIWSATMEELPCAMLANGPACTKAGVPSMVCIRLGMMVSFISTVSAPPMPRSSAVTGSPLGWCR